ncbi:hypothetical protein KW797_00990 [Candidatus Parcubacteria bacterium]|nr:hypothetical protein [Candidatus Parcubacteria bacterium]
MDLNDLKKKVTDELGLGTLPEGEQNDIVTTLGENILKRLSLAAFARLSPEDQKAFSDIASSKGPAAAQTFLTERIPNFAELMQQEARAEIAETKKLLAS